MSAGARCPAALIAELRAEVRHEIRTAGILDVPPRAHLPPPHDHDAEQDVCSALLNGRTFDASRLTADDFYFPLFGAVFAAASVSTPGQASIEDIYRAIVMQGAAGEELRGELVTIRDLTPYTFFIAQRVERLLELSRARRLLARMAAVDLDLRLGQTTTAQARAALSTDGGPRE